MAKLKNGDRVRVSKPEDWPEAVEFKLNGAEGTVYTWVDWPEAMEPYGEYVNVAVDKTGPEGKLYEGANLIFHETNLSKI